MNTTDDQVAKLQEDSSIIHKYLRSAGAGPWELGRRYRYEIHIGIWSSQRALATAHSVSISHVSRCIAIGQLSRGVVDAFGGSDNLSFRIGEKLLRILESIGEAEMEKRAIFATDLKLTRPADLIEMFVLGMATSEIFSRLWVEVGEDGNAIFIRGTDVKKLIPHIKRLETTIKDFSVAVIESKTRKRRAKANDLRRARMRRVSVAQDES